MVSPYIDQLRDWNVAISLGARFSGETEQIGKVAMPIVVSRLLGVQGLGLYQGLSKYK